MARRGRIVMLMHSKSARLHR